jgi:PP-loop superfamily ATP-utilizing enzyme
MPRQIAAFSGGKDSTAMVLRLAELGEDFDCLFTPTGNELPELRAHIDSIMRRIGKKLIEPKGPKLEPLIREQLALPNHAARWCTRMIKIVPCIAYFKANPDSVLLVGLRADEETREGIYDVPSRHPMKEWGWGLQKVQEYVKAKGVRIPKRSDCALCYGQRIGEWFALWQKHPEEFKKGEELEALVSKARGRTFTFRSPQRDSWPAPLVQLRKSFESGRKPRPQDLVDEDDENGACRVCRL